ncbi:hypothetical protein [Streptomyces maremycinicus]|uniref:hypothetical protein n=1 Tax=Streptomyces maremycinicus TaxID=1679753 RepID=UPI000786D5D2|nr:hypothetical protein [Streptomyces sp. NBRC 110468]
MTELQAEETEMMAREHLRTKTLQNAFEESRGRPTEVGTKTAHLAYDVPVEWPSTRAVLSFTSFTDRPVQGVCLAMSEGELEINGLRTSTACMWTDATPVKVDIRFLRFPNSSASLKVWNCWRGRTGTTDAWTENAGLVVQDAGDGVYRFACSAGVGPAAFTDLTFDLEIETAIEDTRDIMSLAGKE